MDHRLDQCPVCKWGLDQGSHDWTGGTLVDKISFAFSAQPTLRVFPQKPLAGSQTFWLCGQLQGGLEVFSNTFQYEKDSATGGGTRTPGPKQPCDIAITAPAMIFKLIFKKSV